MSKAQLGLIGVGIWLTAAQLGLADTVFTSDGSRLVGKVELFGNGKLIIVTEIAGRLEIDAAKVIAIAADEPIAVEFASGDRLVGTIEVSEDTQRSTMRTSLGNLEINPSKITGAWPPGKDSPEVIALKQKVEETKEALTPDWTVTLEAGGVRKEGNVDTLDAQGRFEVVRKTKDDLLKLYLAADYSEQNNRRSKNEYRGGVNYENMFTDRAYWYTRMEMEYDEFENLDLRATVAAGAGYYWLKRPEHEFKNRAGIGYRHESYANGDTSDEAVLDLGLDYRLDIAPWVQFTHSTTYSPDFEEFDDYRLDCDTALLFPLKSDIFKLKVGMRNEYNSRPQRGLDRLDNTYYANLLLELKD